MSYISASRTVIWTSEDTLTLSVPILKVTFAAAIKTPARKMEIRPQLYSPNFNCISVGFWHWTSLLQDYVNNFCINNCLLIAFNVLLLTHLILFFQMNRKIQKHGETTHWCRWSQCCLQLLIRWKTHRKNSHVMPVVKRTCLRRLYILMRNISAARSLSSNVHIAHTKQNWKEISKLI